MPTFNVKSRKTSPITVETIDADTKEGAIDQIIQGLGDGESAEVLQVEEAAVEAALQSKK